MLDEHPPSTRPAPPANMASPGPTTPAPDAMPKPLQLTPEEIGVAFGDERWAARFPPVLSLAQFAALFQVSARTAKAWIASGDFEGATTRMGKHRRVWRDRAVRIAFGRARTRPRAAPAPPGGTDDAGRPPS
jgi:hypothetical protein